MKNILITLVMSLVVIWVGVELLFFMKILGIVFIFIGILCLIASIVGCLKYCLRSSPYSFTPKESRRISALTAVREGSLTAEDYRANYPLENILAERLPDPYSDYLDLFPGMCDELLKSIQKLPLEKQKIEVSDDGMFIQNPWIASRELYWSNRALATS